VGGTTKAISSVGKALLGMTATVAVAAAGFAMFVAGLGLAAKLVSRFVDSLKDVVGPFSAALHVAEAQTKVAEIQQQMKAANQVGGELASMEGSNREVKVALNQLKTNVIDFLSPVFKVTLDTLGMLLDVVNSVFSALNYISEGIGNGVAGIADVLEEMPFIGGIFTYVKDFVTADKIDKAKGKGTLSGMLDPLGNINRVGSAARIKELQDKRFLP
jgi:hypothetical protein